MQALRHVGGIDQALLHQDRRTRNRFLALEFNPVVLKTLSPGKRNIERRMAADRIRHGRAPAIENTVNGCQRRTLGTVNNLQLKIKGILLLRQLVGTQGKHCLILRMRQQGELPAAGQTMLRHLIDMSVNHRASFAERAYNREQHGSAASPPLRIALPEIFSSVRTFEALQLSAEPGNLRPALICSNHNTFLQENYPFPKSIAFLQRRQMFSDNRRVNQDCLVSIFPVSTPAQQRAIAPAFFFFSCIQQSQDKAGGIPPASESAWQNRPARPF